MLAPAAIRAITKVRSVEFWKKFYTPACIQPNVAKGLCCLTSECCSAPHAVATCSTWSNQAAVEAEASLHMHGVQTSQQCEEQAAVATAVDLH
jgi:hypothetical protein